MIKKRTLAIILFLSFISAQAEISFKSISNKISDKASSLSQKAEDTAKSVGKKIQEKFDSITDEMSYLGKKANENVDNLKKIFTQPRHPEFCPLRNITYAPTVDDPNVIAQDTEELIPTIKKYAPVLYLCNELFYPAAVEDLFTAPGTELVYQKDHRSAKPGAMTIVIPKGQVTMEKIYANKAKYKDKDPDLYFNIDQCTKFGSDPKRFSDSNGNVTTPVYVTWQKFNNKYYIVYGFMYGFNGAYPISAPIQGDHDFDLEHITLELNEKKELERIFYATHTSREGVWLPAKHRDINYEGTHPVVYVATTGHGSYPRNGTHVRIFGFGNDVTCKTKKWTPQLVLLYPDTDPRFDVKTMGWVYHPGNYGVYGVESFKRFFTGENDTRKGEPHENVQFCPNPANPNNPIDLLKYQACIESQRPKATIR
jgi:hypothetical protein